MLTQVIRIPGFYAEYAGTLYRGWVACIFHL